MPTLSELVKSRVGESRTYQGSMSCVGYCRLSKETDDCHSIDHQQAKIEQWAAMHDRKAVMFSEVISGKKSDRPQFIEAVTNAIEMQCPLVVWCLSRASRSLADVIELNSLLAEHEASIVAIEEGFDTTTINGRMMMGIMATLAQFEREQTAERTKNVLGQLKAQGKRYCRHPPYGYKLDGKNLVEDQQEMLVIEDVILPAIIRGEGYRKITTRLQQSEFPPRSGKQWRSHTVEGIVKRLKKEGVE